MDNLNKRINVKLVNNAVDYFVSQTKFSTNFIAIH